ncbi:MAG: DUF2911 domain-containing protein [Acidobacteria bacterium]|nr:DUF2911 domain-containing protein [Acidobacteriota bacterium]
MKWCGIVVCLFLTTVLADNPLLASPQRRADTQKPRLSQHGAVSQTINDTVLTIDYNRPVARGRKLFGALVPWGRIWCPGADDATAITLTTDVTVNGKKLEAGSYTLWADPNPNQWTIIFSRAYPAFHTPYPAGQDALRVTATPRAGEHLETLSFYFPVVDGRRAELVLHWGTVVVPLELEVP